MEPASEAGSTSDLFLADRVAVVTGASAGIGRALARALARAGASVVLAARRQERLVELADEINQPETPGRALPLVTDVTRDEDLERLAEVTERELGPADILVNNAGRGYVASVTDLDLDRLDELMRVNFRAAVVATRRFLPAMIERGSGAVINLGSVSGKRGWATGTPYVASKFALRGFSLCLWEEVRQKGIRVIGVYPGYVNSEFFQAMNARFPGIENALSPETVARVVLDALRLPEGATVVELEIWPNALR